MDIEQLQLSSGAYEKLKQLGHSTVEQLAEQWHDDAQLLHDLGPRHRQQIAAELERVRQLQKQQRSRHRS